jgi:hypothetical protein
MAAAAASSSSVLTRSDWDGELRKGEMGDK